MTTEQFRRRIDRVTGEGYLDGLTDRPTADVRRMRDDCREEETRLSYARRLLHGQLDIARAELARRGSGQSDSLIEALREILADPTAETGPARSAANVQVYAPDEEDGHRFGDGVLDGVPLATLPDMSDDELVTTVSAMTEREQAISMMRRRVMDHLDRLQAELVTRYRDGSISIDEIVPPTAS